MQDLNELLSDPKVIWFLIGLVFLLAEFVIPGLIILFFGIGCWVTSLSLLWFPDLSFNFQLTIFLISSIISLGLLRKSLKNWLNSRTKNIDDGLEEYINKHCLVKNDIKPEIGGKVSFKGAIWDADSDTEIKKGDTVMIKAINGIRLFVEPLKTK